MMMFNAIHSRSKERRDWLIAALATCFFEDILGVRLSPRMTPVEVVRGSRARLLLRSFRQ
jgi:hypothetical protein